MPLSLRIRLRGLPAAADHTPWHPARQHLSARNRHATPGHSRCIHHQGQPLEPSSATGSIGNEVISPHVILEPRRLVDTTVRTRPRFRPQLVLRLAARTATQAQLPRHSRWTFLMLTVQPCFSSRAWMRYSPNASASAQTADRLDQWLCWSDPGACNAELSRPAQRHRPGATLRRTSYSWPRYSAAALLSGRHHFFLATSWSIFLSNSSSATRILRRSTSDSSWRICRPSSTFAESKRSLQRYVGILTDAGFAAEVADRQPFARSRSASRSNRSICSLVRRLPMVGSLLGSCRDDYHIPWTNFRGADHLSSTMPSSPI